MVNYGSQDFNGNIKSKSPSTEDFSRIRKFFGSFRFGIGCLRLELTTENILWFRVYRSVGLGWARPDRIHHIPQWREGSLPKTMSLSILPKYKQIRSCVGLVIASCALPFSSQMNCTYYPVKRHTC